LVFRSTSADNFNAMVSGDQAERPDRSVGRGW
jgi:hypothetical protein